MIRKRKIKQILVTMFGLSMGMSASQYTMGASYDSIVGGSVTLEDGDIVNTGNSVGINSSASGSGVKINGSVEITVTNNGSQSKGVYLDNGSKNDLGSGTSLNVTNLSGSSNGASIGILVENKVNSGTELVADHLKINVTNDKQSIGISGTGNGKIDIGTGSEIQVNSTGTSQIITGVSLGNGDQFSMAQGSIQAEASTGSGNVYGISTSGAASIELGTGTKIEALTGGGSSYGISLSSGSSLKADHLDIRNSGSFANGISLGANNNVQLGNNSSLTVSSTGFGQGITVGSNSRIDANALRVELNLTGPSSSGYGIRVEGGQINLGTGSVVQVSGNQGMGILGMGMNTQLNADHLKISTTGSGSIGANIQNGSQFDLGEGSIITTEGTNSGAVWSIGLGSSFKAGHVTLITKGTGSSAVTAQDGGNSFIGSGSHIIAENSGGIVAFSKNTSQKSNIDFWGSVSERNTIFSGGSYGASAQFIGASVNIKNTDIMVDRNGATTLGLWALGGGIIQGENLSIDASASGARGVYTMTDGKIYLTGNTKIITNEGGMALATQYDAGQNSGTISATGTMLIHGDILARGNGVIELTTSEGSYVKGGTTVDKANEGKLSMDLSGTDWDMTRDSQVSNLALSNSQVNFISPQSGVTKSPFSYGRLDIENLSGSGGLFQMRTDLENLQGDLVSISGTSAGSHKLIINNQGGANVDSTQELTVVETTDGNAAFSLQNQVEVGGYLYGLKKSGTDWALYSTGKATNTTSGGVNVFSGAYLLNYAETQTLVERLGELRQVESKGDIWARVYGGEFNSRSDGFLSSYNMSYQGLQIGVDQKKEWKENSGTLYYGGFLGYGKGSLDYGAGNGSIDSKTFGIYGTYIHTNGFYTDLVLKHVWMKNDFNVLDTASTQVNGKKMNTNGLFGSIEIGKKHYFDQNEKQGWYVEPQAQVTIGSQNGGRFNASNGLEIDIDGYRSILGRAGVRMGYDLKKSKNPVNGYLKISHIREFDGDVNYRLNNVQNSTSYKGSWWTYGVGINTKINDKHNVYFDIERASGGKFDQPWKISGGYRFTW